MEIKSFVLTIKTYLFSMACHLQCFSKGQHSECIQPMWAPLWWRRGWGERVNAHAYKQKPRWTNIHWNMKNSCQLSISTCHTQVDYRSINPVYLDRWTDVSIHTIGMYCNILAIRTSHVLEITQTILFLEFCVIIL